MSQIIFQKKVFNKEQYGRVIDTQFNQLLNKEVEIEQPSFSIDDFFELYENLFYQIPKEGNVNSHHYILKKEADYLNISINQDDIQILLNEITSLRQQLLDTQTIVNELTKR